GGIRRGHSAVAHAARCRFLSEPGPIRPGTVVGRPGSLGKNSAFRVLSLRRRATRLCWCVLCDDGSYVVAGDDSAEVSSRNCPGTSHRNIRIGYIASQVRHPGDPAPPNDWRKIPVGTFPRDCETEIIGSVMQERIYSWKKLRTRKPRFAGRSASQRMK